MLLSIIANNSPKDRCHKIIISLSFYVELLCNNHYASERYWPALLTHKNKNTMHKITASHATNIAMHIFSTAVFANTGECDFQTFCSRQNIMKLNYTVETRQRARYFGGLVQIIVHTILEPQVIMCNTRSFMANIKFTKKEEIKKWKEWNDNFCVAAFWECFTRWWWWTLGLIIRLAMVVKRDLIYCHIIFYSYFWY